MRILQLLDGAVLCDWLLKPRSTEHIYAVIRGDEFFVEFWLILVMEDDRARPCVVSESPRVGFYSVGNGMNWLRPSPFNILSALAKEEVSGESKRRLLYDAYWGCLQCSDVLREWVAVTRPEYWKLVSEAFPLVDKNED